MVGGLRKTDKVREGGARKRERAAALTLNMFRLGSLNSAVLLSPFSLSSFQVRILNLKLENNLDELQHRGGQSDDFGL